MRQKNKKFKDQNVSHFNKKSADQLGADEEYAKFLYSQSNELYVATGHLIYVYNAHGRNLLGVLKKHSCNVVGVVEVEDKGKKQIVSFDERGQVIFYPPAFKQGRAEVDLKCIPLKNHKKYESSLVSSIHHLRENVWVATLVSNAKDTGTLVLVELGPEAGIEALSQHVIPGRNKVNVSSDGRFVAAFKSHKLYVAEFYLETANRLLRLKRECYHWLGDKEGTCVYFHPHKDMLATGMSNGSIILWFDFFRERPVKVVVHWHTLPVRDICFSLDGNMFSGAEECVLVRWQLVEDNQKSFLPRLGSPIVRVEADATGSYVAVLHQDRAISIVDSKEMHCEGVIRRLSSHIPQNMKNKLSVGLLYHRATTTLVKNGPIGQLQFFNATAGTLVHNMDITLANFVTRERGREFPNPEVTKAVISADGLWMATSEACALTPDVTEVVLKFWCYSLVDQRWEQNTLVQQPHSGEINAICCSRNDVQDAKLTFVTCAEDAKFMVWELITYSDIGVIRKHWNCLISRTFRGLGCKTCSFSSDGSLLAVAFGSVVTLWDRATYSLISSLSQSYLNEDIRDIAFGSTNSTSSALVSRCDDYLVSWDLLSCSILWRVYLPSVCLVSDPSSGIMAIFSKKNEVFFFKANQSQPVSSSTELSPSGVNCATFAPSQSTEPELLYYIDQAQNFFSMYIPRGKQTSQEEPIPQHLRQMDLNEGMNEDEGNDFYSALRARSKVVQSSKFKRFGDDHLEVFGISSDLVEQLSEVSVPNISFESYLGCIGDLLPSVKKNNDPVPSYSKKIPKEETKRSSQKALLAAVDDLPVESVLSINFDKIVELL